MKGRNSAHVLVAELFLGAVNDDTEIVSIDAEGAADLVFVALLEEDRSQDGGVLRREEIEHTANALPGLGRDQGILGIDGWIGRVRLILGQRLGAPAGAKRLEQ